MDPLTPIDAIEFTRDRPALARRIQKLEGRRGVFLPTRSAIEEAHLQFMTDAVRLRSEVTLSAVQAAAVYLGTLRESRKSIIFVSRAWTASADATTTSTSWRARPTAPTPRFTP
jgi:hypothetical protein